MAAYDYQGAIKAGANPQDVMKYMATNTGYNAAGALKAGAKQNDVLSYMANLPFKSKSFAGSNEAPGSVAQYAAESADPASNASNPKPNWFQNLIAGKPIAPAQAKDTSGNISNDGGGSQTFAEPLRVAGSTLANVFSDAPAVLAAIPQAIIHPINTIKGLVSAVSNISAETGQALHEGLYNGDWTRMGQDLDKTEISVENHPLQTILLMDEAFKSSKSVLSDVSEKGPAASFKDMASTTASKALSDINKARTNISNLFSTRTTLDGYTVKLGQGVDDLINKNKTVADTQGGVDTFNDKNTQLSKQNSDLQTQIEAEQSKGAQKNQATIDDLKNKQTSIAQQQIELKSQDFANKQKLAQAKSEAAEAFSKQKDTVNKETSDQQKENSLKAGFNSSISEMSDAVSSFFKGSLDRISGVYDTALGNAKVDTAGIIDGLSKYKDELLSGNKFKSADGAQQVMDQLKLRQIMSEYKGDASELYQQLQSEDINPKLWEKLSPEELQDRYKPLTSDNLKTSKNAIYNAVEKGADESSIKEYAEHVIPKFNEAFGDAVKDVYGQDRLDQIKKNDADWSTLKGNPLSSKASITIDDLQKNWDSIETDLSKVQGGGDLVRRLQSFVGEHILNNAESLINKGEFDFKKIFKGLDEYGSMLDDTTKSRLEKVAEDNKDIVEMQKNKATEFKQSAQDLQNARAQSSLDLEKAKADTATSLKDATEKAKQETSSFEEVKDKLEDDRKKLEQDAKDIGGTEAEIVKRIGQIDSPEALASYVEKTGKTPEEIFSVYVNAVFHGLEKEIGTNRIEPETDTKGNPVLDKNGNPVFKKPNFSAEKIGNAISSIQKLGGDLGKGAQTVLDRMMGQTEEMAKKGDLSDTQKAWRNVKEMYDKWKTTKETKRKSFFKRAANAAFGTLILTTLPFGKFFGIRKIISAFEPELSAEELNTRARVEAKGKSNLPGRDTLKKSALAKVGVNNQDKDDDN